MKLITWALKCLPEKPHDEALGLRASVGRADEVSG